MRTTFPPKYLATYMTTSSLASYSLICFVTGFLYSNGNSHLQRIYDIFNWA
jgi:hypothetical protein